MKENSPPECKHCGVPLPRDHVGPCPKCGKESQAYSIEGDVRVPIRVSGRMKYTQVTKYALKHPWKTGISTVVAFASPFVGQVLVGLPGVLVGLLLSAVSFYFGWKGATTYYVEKHTTAPSD